MKDDVVISIILKIMSNLSPLSPRIYDSSVVKSFDKKHSDFYYKLVDLTERIKHFHKGMEQK